MKITKYWLMKLEKKIDLDKKVKKPLLKEIVFCEVVHNKNTTYFRLY
jgi:G:T-mismatch repair DNA endonuclease (very short patch repair protein)